MDTLTETAAAVLVIVTLISAVIVLVSKVFTVAKRIDQAIGKDAQGKTLAQRHEEQGEQLSQQNTMLQQMDNRLTIVEQVLSPPGQDPLPSRVRKVEQEVDEVRNDVKQVGAKVDTLTALVRRDIEDRQ